MNNCTQTLLKQRHFHIGNDYLNTEIKLPKDIVVFLEEHHRITRCSFDDLDLEAQKLFLQQNELNQSVGGIALDINMIQFYLVPNLPENQLFYIDYKKDFLVDKSNVYLYWDLSQNTIWSNSNLLSAKCELLKGIDSSSIEVQNGLYKKYAILLEFYIQQSNILSHHSF